MQQNCNWILSRLKLRVAQIVDVIGRCDQVWSAALETYRHSRAWLTQLYPSFSLRKNLECFQWFGRMSWASFPNQVQSRTQLAGLCSMAKQSVFFPPKRYPSPKGTAKGCCKNGCLYWVDSKRTTNAPLFPSHGITCLRSRLVCVRQPHTHLHTWTHSCCRYACTQCGWFRNACFQLLYWYYAIKSLAHVCSMLRIQHHGLQQPELQNLFNSTLRTSNTHTHFPYDSMIACA